MALSSLIRIFQASKYPYQNVQIQFFVLAWNLKNHSKYLEENSNKVLNYAEVNNICEECKEEDENVKSNLIMFGYKVCNSCKTSKTIFPL